MATETRRLNHHGQVARVRSDCRSPWWLSLAFSTAALFTAGLAAAQPQGHFFPLTPTTPGFDPNMALAAVNHAAAGRDASAAAFAGLAEQPQVDLLLGQATTRIPIQIPPGRKGMTPQVALSYGSRGGNGLLGRGWDLAIPSVKRSTRRGVPIDWSNAAYPYSLDEFILVLPNGTVVLDRILAWTGPTLVYGSSSEELFLRAVFNLVTNIWVVTDKSGVQYTFGGGTSASRLGSNVSQVGYTFAWGITEIRDPSGNLITYQYAAYGLNGNANAWLYPAKIHWGKNAAVTAYTDIFHICFAYDAIGTCADTSVPTNPNNLPPPRPDPLVSHAGGYEASLNYRISTIKVWADGESSEAVPTRKYLLTYAQNDLTGQSELQRVDLRNSLNQTLTPTTFTYNTSARGLASASNLLTFPSSGRTQPPLRRNTINSGTRSDLIDMTGDGRPDWVECDASAGIAGGDYFVYRNLGDGTLGPRERWTGPACAFHSPYYDLMDVNGDGRPDWVFTFIYASPPPANRDWMVWYNTGSGFDGPHTWPVPPALRDIQQSLWVNALGDTGGARDLNGDSLPDAIDAWCNCDSQDSGYPASFPGYCPGQEGSCRVYLNSGSGFDAPGVLWRWPRIEIVPGRTNLFNDATGQTEVSLQDLTGDGLVDLVVSRPPAIPNTTGNTCHLGYRDGLSCLSDADCGAGSCIDPDSWGVYVNTGTGFAFDSVCSGGSRNGQSCVVDADCPGSGICRDLPAVYWAAPTRVDGSRMAIDEVCRHSNTPQRGWPPIGMEGSLRDMNGDGLVDYVDSNVDCDMPTQGGPWRVFINTGNGFVANPVTWNGTAGALVQKFDSMPDVPGFSVQVVVGDTFDLDGDGIAEYVEAPMNDLLHVTSRRGQGGAPGTLQKQENGLGASIAVAYARNSDPYSSAKMCFGGVNDGQVCTFGVDCPNGTCDVCKDCNHAPFPLTVVESLTTTTGFSGTGHTLTMTYKFLAPYFDWQERQFRGFGWGTEKVEGSGVSRRREAQFIQPGAHPRDAVTACGAPSQSCAALAGARVYKGKQRYMRTRESGTKKVLAENTSIWETVTITDPRASGIQTTVVRLAEQTETLYGSSVTTTTTTAGKQELDQDNYNNVTEVRRRADGLLVGKTRTVYQYDTTRWIVDRPTAVERLDASSNVRSRKEYGYDTRGNVTQIRDWLDVDALGGAARTITRTVLGYAGDPGTAGQPTTITDARGNPTTLTYATATGESPACNTYALYPCKITNALNQITSRSYRLEFGRSTGETDPNGATVEHEYDRFGRLYQVFRPLLFDQDPSTLNPWRRFTYVLGSPGAGGGQPTPSYVQTEMREPNHAEDFRKEVRFYDSLGRLLETKADSVVDGTPRTIVREAFGFDGAGRANLRYAPYTTNGGPTQYEAPTGPTTTSIFDGLDRVTQVTKPDNNVVTATYDPAGTTDIHDENYVACNGQSGSVSNASCPGKRTVEERDALGRLLHVKVYKGAATLDSDTVNDYDALDRLKTTQIGTDANTKVTFTYDSLGRRIALTEKDSGTWQYGYDDADNLLYQNDPKLNQHLEWCFDQLNRPTRKVSFTSDAYSGDSCANGTLRAVYTYDSCTGGKGRLCTEHDPGRYDLQRTYDARGRVHNEVRTIDVAGLERTLFYSFTYDEADRLKDLIYPSPTDNTYELLTYGYDVGGQLVTAATPGNTYLRDAMYDVFGRSKHLSLADGAVLELRSYFDASANFRLKQIAVTRGLTPLQIWNYGPTTSGIQNGYDRAGNLLQIDDITSSQYADNSDRDTDWLYTYDGIGRLTNAAWGARAATAAFQYDGLGNMSQGNLVFPNLLVNTSVAFTPHATRRHHMASMTPPGAGTPLQYETDGAGGDGNGGVRSRPATVSGDAAKTITYDVEGRVQTVTVEGETVESIYDDRGERIARIVNGTDVTFFFGRYVEVRGNQVVRHVYAGNRRIAFSPIAAPPSLALAALADDHPEVMLARAANDAASLANLSPLDPDIGPVASTGGVVLLVIGTLLLGIVPSRVRVGIVGHMRRGRVAILVVLYVVTLPAWPRPPRPPGREGAALAQCPGPATSYPAYIVHVDHLGSTTLLTAYKVPNETDGAVMQYYRYGPYGKMQAYDRNGTPVSSGAELTELTYTGQRWDRLARIYYYGARFYDPLIARFVSIDPAREYMNMYAYVRWAPIRWIDPSGMIVVPDLGGAAGLNYALYFLHAPGIVPPKTFAPFLGRKPEFEGLGGGPLGYTSEVPSHAEGRLAAEFHALLTNAEAYTRAIELGTALMNLAALAPTLTPAVGAPPHSVADAASYLAQYVEAIQAASVLPLFPPALTLALDILSFETTRQQINDALGSNAIQPLQAQVLQALNILSFGAGVTALSGVPQVTYGAAGVQAIIFGVIGPEIGYGPTGTAITDSIRR